MKSLSQLLFFLVAASSLQPTAFASEPIATSSSTNYSLVVSNAEGSDVFLTARTQNLFTFKYCDATLKNSSSQELINLSMQRTSDRAFFSNAAKNKQLAEKLFSNPNCRLLGKASYGFVKDYRNDENELYIKSYGWMTGPSEWATVLTGSYTAKQIFDFGKNLRSVRAKNNTETIIGTLKSPGLRKGNLRLAILSTVGIAVSSFFTFEINRQNDDLDLLLKSAINNDNSSTVLITEESLPEYSKRIMHAIDLSVEEGNLRAF